MTYLTIFLFFLVKHTICDLMLQGTWRLRANKTPYIRSPRAHGHYLVHGVGTVLLLLWFCNPYIALCVGIVDYIAHWHIDWFKSNFIEWSGWRFPTPGFWWLQALDQTLHFVTYYIFTVYLVDNGLIDVTILL